MLATRRNKLTGLLFLSPALLFVPAFTFVPAGAARVDVVQQLVADHAPEAHRDRQLHRAFSDTQFWTSLTYSLKYTLFITPILIVGGYLFALLVATNSPIRRVTRTIVFIPVVIGLGVSSLLCGTGCSTRRSA